MSVSSMSDTCVICHENVQKETKALECGHTFHSSCLVDWFRTSPSCPLCRALPTISGQTLHARCKYLCKKSRQKNAPPELKALVMRLSKKRSSQTTVSKAITLFNTQNKLLLREKQKLATSSRRIKCEIREAERIIGAFHSVEYPLPPLVVQNEYF